MIYAIGGLCIILLLLALICFAYAVFPLKDELSVHLKDRPLLQAGICMGLGISLLGLSGIIFYLFRYLF